MWNPNLKLVFFQTDLVSHLFDFVFPMEKDNATHLHAAQPHVFEIHE